MRRAGHTVEVTGGILAVRECVTTAYGEEVILVITLDYFMQMT